MSARQLAQAQLEGYIYMYFVPLYIQLVFGGLESPPGELDSPVPVEQAYVLLYTHSEATCRSHCLLQVLLGLSSPPLLCSKKAWQMDHRLVF